MGSDHYPIKIDLLLSSSQFNITRNKLSTNWDVYKANLPKHIPSNLTNDINAINNFITESIKSAAKIATTSKPIGRNQKIPFYLKNLIKARKKSKNRVKKTKAKQDKEKFNFLNNSVKRELTSINNRNWEEFINGLNKFSTSSKPFWDRINNIKNNNSHLKQNKLPTLIENNKQYLTDKEKADLFADRLANTFSDSNDSSFNNQFKSQIESEYNNSNFLSHEHHSNDLFTMNELNLMIKTLNSRSSPGLDKINNIHIKNSSPEFRNIILVLFNQTIIQKSIPLSWKESLITMIPKKQVGSSNPKDYRPISLTCCLSKLCEKLILSRLTSFLDNNNLIIKQQSGFRKHRQTKDNILVLIQKITESFIRKKKVLGIFFDIQSAFDKVWHVGLIHKMVTMKIPKYIILWIINFLDTRVFLVKVNNIFSDRKSIKAGVPQGAVLSPTLFSIYINDIPRLDSKNKSGSLLFADDLASFLVFRSLKTIEKALNTYLLSLGEWLKKWRLIMSPGKCSYMVFSKTTQLNESIDLKLLGGIIPKCDQAIFLGIRFDPKLSFKYQAKYLEEACIKRFSILKILSHKKYQINKILLVRIYLLLIRSLIDYSAIIFTCLNNQTKKKVQTIQNNCLKIIFKKPKRYSTIDIHKLANICLIEDRVKQLNSKFVMKSLVNNNPMINSLAIEYLNFIGARQLETKKNSSRVVTPLCLLRSSLFAYFNSLKPP